MRIQLSTVVFVVCLVTLFADNIEGRRYRQKKWDSDEEYLSSESNSEEPRRSYGSRRHNGGRSLLGDLGNTLGSLLGTQGLFDSYGNTKPKNNKANTPKEDLDDDEIADINMGMKESEESSTPPPPKRTSFLGNLGITLGNLLGTRGRRFQGRRGAHGSRRHYGGRSLLGDLALGNRLGNLLITQGYYDSVGASGTKAKKKAVSTLNKSTKELYGLDDDEIAELQISASSKNNKANNDELDEDEIADIHMGMKESEESPPPPPPKRASFLGNLGITLGNLLGTRPRGRRFKGSQMTHGRGGRFYSRAG